MARLFPLNSSGNPRLVCWKCSEKLELMGLKSDVTLKPPIKFQVSYFKSKLQVYCNGEGCI